jgi:hypothetical protein
MQGNVTLADRGRAERSRSESLCARAQVAMERSQALIDIRQQIMFGKERPPAWTRGLLRDSAYARLVAEVATRPVIEQAKGIIMAQTGCEAGQAFSLLRRASQRMNLPVRDLAARVVAHAARCGEPDARRPAPGTRRQPARAGR